MLFFDLLPGDLPLAFPPPAKKKKKRRERKGKEKKEEDGREEQRDVFLAGYISSGARLRSARVFL